MTIGGVQGSSPGRNLLFWTAGVTRKNPVQQAASPPLTASTEVATRSSLLESARGIVRAAAEGLRVAFTSFAATVTPIIERVFRTATPPAAAGEPTSSTLRAGAGAAGLDLTERASVLQSSGAVSIDSALAKGKFKINGKSINVMKDDTIDGVIAAINTSGAGVTAALAADRLVITSNGPSEDAIELGDDTSGFLAAAKLADAVTVRGNRRDDEQDLESVAAFAGVTKGSFTVNGVEIDVDPKKDRLAEVLQRITESDAGVTAAYDSVSQRVTLTAKATGDTAIELAGDTSGLLAALKLDDTAVFTRGATDTPPEAAEAEVIETLTGVVRTTNTGDVVAGASAAVDTLMTAVATLGKHRGHTPGFRTDLKHVLDDMVDALRHVGVHGLGVAEANDQVRLVVDEARLEESLEGLGHRGRAARAVEDLIEGFAGRVADLAARRIDEPRAQRIVLEVAPPVVPSPVKPTYRYITPPR